MTDNTKKYYFFSDAKYLTLDIPVPYEQMHQEAKNLKNRFTPHRGGENIHSGWKSISLYGLSEDKHDTWKDYGYSSSVDAEKDFHWTTAAHECPSIVNWIKNSFPSKRLGRVRLMLLEAGGKIDYHSDTKHRILENINIPLNNPRECLWYWKDDKPLYMEPGKVYAMNISYEHAVINHSSEDRYHLIISRYDSTKEWMDLINDACARSGETGEYQLHEIAV
jgi:hypothetical protein